MFKIGQSLSTTTLINFNATCYIIYRIWHRKDNFPIQDSDFQSFLQTALNLFSSLHNDLSLLHLHSNDLLCIILIYTYRLRAKSPTEIPGIGSEYRVFATALYLALDKLGIHIDSSLCSSAARLPVHVLSAMLSEFTQILDNDLDISHTEFKKWLNAIQKVVDYY
jgi:hypothetical protein